jgi:hypothetical protein
MHFTAVQSKKSVGALNLSQIILAFVLLIVVLVGQASALPSPIYKVAPLRGVSHADK